MVFAGIYPIDSEDYEDLRTSIEKLQLNDASLTFEPESSAALWIWIPLRVPRNATHGNRAGTSGPGIRHERDHHRSQRYVYRPHHERRSLRNAQPLRYALPTVLDYIEEPYIKAQIITPTDYIGQIMTLCLGKRGVLIKQHYLTGNRIELNYEMPLAEIVFDFYDKLKSITKGYASFDYFQIGYRRANLVKWIYC